MYASINQLRYARSTGPTHERGPDRSNGKTLAITPVRNTSASPNATRTISMSFTTITAAVAAVWPKNLCRAAEGIDATPSWVLVSAFRFLMYSDVAMSLPRLASGPQRRELFSFPLGNLLGPWARD